MNQSKSIHQNLDTVEEIKELALKYLDKYQPSKKLSYNFGAKETLWSPSNVNRYQSERFTGHCSAYRRGQV